MSVKPFERMIDTSICSVQPRIQDNSGIVHLEGDNVFLSDDTQSYDCTKDISYLFYMSLWL